MTPSRPGAADITVSVVPGLAEGAERSRTLNVMRNPTRPRRVRAEEDRMDQIGALGPGTVERLVLWAKDNRLRGSIDVRGDHSATMYFSAGFIAHIDDGEGTALAPTD